VGLGENVAVVFIFQSISEYSVLETPHLIATKLRHSVFLVTVRQIHVWPGTCIWKNSVQD